jgi:anti-anti-sigma regulatory factor
MICEPATRFRLDIAWHGDQARVAVHGTLDGRAAVELAHRLRELAEVARPRLLLLDLVDTACTGTAGVQAVAGARAAMPADGQITIVANSA